MSDIVERLRMIARDLYSRGEYEQAEWEGNLADTIEALRTQLQTALDRETATTARYDARIAELEVSNLQTRRHLKRLWALARGNDPDDTEEGPRCRDCADMDGVCHSGLPCNPQKRAEVQIAKLRAENSRLREALKETK